MICPSIRNVSSTEFTYASTRMRTRVHCRCSSTSKMTSLITSYNTKLRSARRGRGICDDLSYMIGKTWSVAVTSSSSHVFPYSYLFILGCTYNFVLVCVRVCVCVFFSKTERERRTEWTPCRTMSTRRDMHTPTCRLCLITCPWMLHNT